MRFFPQKGTALMICANMVRATDGAPAEQMNSGSLHRNIGGQIRHAMLRRTLTWMNPCSATSSIARRRPVKPFPVAAVPVESELNRSRTRSPPVVTQRLFEHPAYTSESENCARHAAFSAIVRDPPAAASKRPRTLHARKRERPAANRARLTGFNVPRGF